MILNAYAQIFLLNIPRNETAKTGMDICNVRRWWPVIFELKLNNFYICINSPLFPSNKIVE